MLLRPDWYERSVGSAVVFLLPPAIIPHVTPQQNC